MVPPPTHDRRWTQWRPIKPAAHLDYPGCAAPRAAIVGARTNTWENLMIGRLAAFIYGIASYLVFFLSFVYAVPFIGN